MGIFSSPCPNCSSKVRNALRFCPSCGAPGPGARFHCHRCDKPLSGWNRNCPHCSADQIDAEGRFIVRPYLIEQSWRRNDEDLVARFHVQDVQGTFFKIVVIEEGNSALVFQNGQCAGKLGPGRYDHTGLARRLISWFNLMSPAVFVLVDTADVRLRLACDCLTSESLPVEVAANVIVSIEDPLAFFQNLVKSRTVVRRGELEALLEKEIETGVQAAVRGVSLDTVVGNTKLRDLTVQLLDSHLARSLGRLGLRLVHVPSLEFESEELRRIIGRAREVFEVRQVDLEAVQKAKSKGERVRGEDALREAEHDVALREERRRQDLQREREKDAVARAQGGVLERKVGDEYSRERDVKDQEAQLDVLNRKRDADRKSWEAQQDAQLRFMERKLAMFQNASAHALAAALDGPESERILRLEEIRAQERMTPEQLLYFVASKSPDVARALAKKYEAEGVVKQATFEKILAEQKADIVDSVAQRAMENVADVAEGRALSSGAMTCPSCGRPAERRYKFCPHCRGELRKG